MVLRCRATPRDSLDDSITETFSRIYSGAQLLTQPLHKSRICLPVSEVEFPTPMFQSIDQARQYLHLLLSHIFHLTEQARQQGKSTAGSSLELVGHQRGIQAKLSSLLRTYIAS